MRMERDDLLKGLISEKDIRENLIAFFPDSIIVKNNLKIVGASNRVADIIGCRCEELTGQFLPKFFYDSVENLFLKELSKGFFDNLIVSLKGKNGTTISCKVSGFYLGIISDINDLAILRIEPFDKARIISKRLDACRDELDEFVYRSTHDLRGPLATMRGLINLMKMETGSVSPDMKNFISLLDTYALTLDERLFNLNYLSETSLVNNSVHDLDCAELESTLRSTLEQNLVISNFDLSIVSNQRFFHKVNGRTIISMLNQLLMYFIKMPRNKDVKLVYTLEKVPSGIQLTIYSEGFISDNQIRQAIQNKDPLYTTVIMYPNLINFFAAVKSSHRLNTTIHVDFVFEASQQFTVQLSGTE